MEYVLTVIAIILLVIGALFFFISYSSEPPIKLQPVQTQPLQKIQTSNQTTGNPAKNSTSVTEQKPGNETSNAIENTSSAKPEDKSK